MTDHRPVWLLDVDGVINACTVKPDRNVWPLNDWISTRVLKLPIVASRPVLDFIRATHESGRAEIRWLTTWMDDAQKIADEFDLPTFPVEGGPEYDRRLRDRVFDREAWWKQPAAERVLRDEQRPLVWADDDITWSLGRRGQDDMRRLGPVLFVSPNERTGLCKRHLRQIDDFLDLYPAEPVPAGTESKD